MRADRAIAPRTERRRLVSAATLLFSILSSRSALSAPPEAEDASARASAHFFRGNALYDEGKFVEAEAAYQAAWDAKQGADVAGNLGNVEMLVGQWAEAATHLTYALAEFPISGEPKKKAFLQGRLEEARKHVGALRIAVSLPDAAVSIDGAAIDAKALGVGVFVEPGEHVVTAEREGYGASRVSVDVGEGASQEVSITLHPVEVAPPPGSAEPNLVAVGAAAGLSVVAFGVAIGSTVASSSAAGDVETLNAKLDAEGGCPGSC